MQVFNTKPSIARKTSIQHLEQSQGSIHNSQLQLATPFATPPLASLEKPMLKKQRSMKTILKIDPTQQLMDLNLPQPQPINQDSVLYSSLLHGDNSTQFFNKRKASQKIYRPRNNLSFIERSRPNETIDTSARKHRAQSARGKKKLRVQPPAPTQLKKMNSCQVSRQGEGYLNRVETSILSRQSSKKRFSFRRDLSNGYLAQEAHSLLGRMDAPNTCRDQRPKLTLKKKIPKLAKKKIKFNPSQRQHLAAVFNQFKKKEETTNTSQVTRESSTRKSDRPSHTTTCSPDEKTESPFAMGSPLQSSQDMAEANVTFGCD